MRLDKRAVVLAGLVAATAVTVLLVRRFWLTEPAPSFRFVTVERGNLQARVSATGTLNAVTTVSVGTQVSGQVSALFVDFNARVKKGQLLARIDPTIAQQGVADAQANLEKLQAQTNQSSRDQDRNRELAAGGLIATSALEQGGATLEVARATERSADVSLQRAQQNLSYTAIHAPIDGVIVERNVNVGQTVAASLSAPQLFLIANDLTHMRILALVGESDIDRIEQGQLVTFTVQALPGQAFTGNVQQVRLQSTTLDNVVNYTVVVTLENPEGKLLPGMTARVDFLVQSAADVLKVANAALRYKPSDEVLTRLGTAAARGDATTTRAKPTAGTGGPSGAMRARREEASGPGSGRDGTLYFLDSDGRLEVARVQTGISDGVSTQVRGQTVAEGMKVIDGAVPAKTAALQAETANPLGSAQQGGGGRGRPGGGF